MDSNKHTNTLKTLIQGYGNYEVKKLTPAIKNQYLNFKKVWKDSFDKTFGIERILRLILVLLPFAYPTLYIRHFSGFKGVLFRKLVVEFYVILKLIFSIIILYFQLYHEPLFIYIVIYLMSETLMYLFGLVFLSDIYIAPISYKRSLILLFINYLETTLGFAIVYIGFNLVTRIHSGITAFYFSIVTSTTLGYGDLKPDSESGQLIVIVQIVIMVFYVILFFNKTVTSIDKKYIKNQGD